MRSATAACGGSERVEVAATVALAGFISLVASRLRQLLSLSFQQLVKCFLYAASYQFLELTLLQ